MTTFSDNEDKVIEYIEKICSVLRERGVDSEFINELCYVGEWLICFEEILGAAHENPAAFEGLGKEMSFLSEVFRGDLEDFPYKWPTSRQ